MASESSFHDEEIGLLLTDIIDRYGYDFTGYTLASLKRRISRFLILKKLSGFAALRHAIRHSENLFNEFVEEVTVTVTDMFRDPPFYRCLAEEIFPALRTRPFIRIWHAGCSTGEEVYSVAILLHEAGLLPKSLLYATDINPGVLETLRKGIYPLGNFRQYSENYIQSGGRKDFSSYYTARYGFGKFDERLQQRMIISTHNLVSDSSFNEFQLIICRNVLIYFDKDLQNRVLKLFNDSLEPSGCLALGANEGLRFSEVATSFTPVCPREKIWKKTEKTAPFIHQL
ncbi:MAG: protein-glutamate O-methyltransferase CheR [Flavihumibacter sp.]